MQHEEEEEEARALTGEDGGMLACSRADQAADRRAIAVVVLVPEVEGPEEAGM